MFWPRLTLLLAVAALGCDVDDHRPGYRGECGNAGGTLLGCDDDPIETPEDACWKLVECGAIPVENPEEDPNCCFDWARCVDFINEMHASRRDFALACIEASTCDELKWSDPDSPRGRPALCLQYGGQ